MSKINLLFIRHGKTDYNVNHQFQGQSFKSKSDDVKDMPLNFMGIEEAARAIPVLDAYEIKPDVIFSSPLLRARQTGEFIREHFGIEVKTDDRLMEMFFGSEWEGLTIEEFRRTEFNPPYIYTTPTSKEIIISNGRQLRDMHKSTDSEYDNLAHPGGETKQEVAGRVRKAIEEFISQNPQYKTICIPTHNALMRFFLSTIDRDEAAISVENTEIVHVLYDTDIKEYFIYNRIKPAKVA